MSAISGINSALGAYQTTAARTSEKPAESKKEAAVATDNSLIVKAKNETGTELPSTGGMGTTIFYVVGGILVVGAAVLLISKRRMSDR